jgi:hypothetical protein
LDVGYTPFVAMLAPRSEGYVIENLFQEYVERGVLDQALCDHAASDIGATPATSRCSSTGSSAPRAAVQ